MSEKKSFDHAYFLGLALHEARKRQGFCAPNPSVGAVAVVDGKVLALAHHQQAGCAHAEAALLSKLPQGLQNLILYVTLEPCQHWGKTPPCTEAIVDYGVSMVVFAYRDPMVHLPNQDAIQQLEHHGIRVLHLPLPAIDEFYAPYAYWVQQGLPWVEAKWAQSLDGKMGYLGTRVQLSGEKAQEFTHQGRLRADLILTTAKTILIDNPRLNVRIGDERIDKPLAIIDRNLQLTSQEAVFQSQAPIHIFHQHRIVPTWRHPLVTFHPLDDFENLAVLLTQIAALGYHALWLEAGPQLMQTMHQQHLVQRTNIIICPKVLGIEGLTAVSDQNFFARAKQMMGQSLGDDVLIRVEWEHK